MRSDKQLKEMLAEEEKNSVIQIMRKDGSKSNLMLARATPEDVDMYHKMEVKDLIDEYLGLYYILYIYGQSSIRDLQILDLIAREIYEFRSKSVQMELEERLKKMNDGHKAAMEKCHKMKLEDLIDRYISLSKGGGVKDGVSMCEINIEIWEFRSSSEQEEFKKRIEINQD